MTTESDLSKRAKEVKDLRAKYLKAQKASNRALADYKRALDDLLEVI